MFYAQFSEYGLRDGMPSADVVEVEVVSKNPTCSLANSSGHARLRPSV